MEGRTSFIIAHRLSTISHCDLILVVNDGKVVEQGCHDDLVARGGLYAELHEAQTGARRGQAAARVSSATLSELTKAVVQRHDEGSDLSGPALAKMAHALAGDAKDPGVAAGGGRPVAVRAGRSRRAAGPGRRPLKPGLQARPAGC